MDTGNIATILRRFRPFKEARDFARGLGLKSGAEWRKFCKGDMPEKGALPPDVPSNPNKTYRDNGWAGMGDWLGTGRIRKLK